MLSLYIRINFRLRYIQDFTFEISRFFNNGIDRKFNRYRMRNYKSFCEKCGQSLGLEQPWFYLIIFPVHAFCVHSQQGDIYEI